LVEDVVFENFQAGTSSGVFLAGIETVSWLDSFEQPEPRTDSDRAKLEVACWQERTATDHDSRVGVITVADRERIRSQ
jgi:hypothetical protein